MGKYMKGAITILVLSIPNFILGQAVEAAPIEVEKSKIAPMEFSWNRNCASDIAWQERASNDEDEKTVLMVVTELIVCPARSVVEPIQVHQLNRYDNGMPATAMLSSEIYFREY